MCCFYLGMKSVSPVSDDVFQKTLLSWPDLDRLPVYFLSSLCLVLQEVVTTAMTRAMGLRPMRVAAWVHRWEAEGGEATGPATDLLPLLLESTAATLSLQSSCCMDWTQPRWTPTASSISSVSMETWSGSVSCLFLLWGETFQTVQPHLQSHNDMINDQHKLQILLKEKMEIDMQKKQISICFQVLA